MGIKTVEEVLQVAVVKIDRNWKEVVEEIWRTSRPGVHSRPPLEDIMSIDSPIGDFSGVTFKMRVPILLRELLFSLKEYTAWSTSSRVDNIMESWSVIHPDYIPDETIRKFYPVQIEKSKERLLKGVEAGQSQDEYRQNLPVSYICLLYTSPSPRDRQKSRMPSSA